MFLSDQTSTIQAAFVSNGGSLPLEISSLFQATFGNHTVVYMRDAQSESMGAFIVQESTSGSSAQGSLSGATFTRFVPDGVKSTQLVSFSANNYLLTFEGAFNTPGAATVQSWALSASGSFATNNEAATSSQSIFGGASNLSASSIPFVVNNTMLVVTTSDGAAANNDKDVFVLAISGSGVISQVANGTATVASVDTSPPVGVVVQAVNTSVASGGFEAVVFQASGNTTTFPIKADGSLGSPSAKSLSSLLSGVTSPTNFAASVTNVSSLIQSSTSLGQFYAIAQAGDDFILSFTTNATTGTLTANGNPADTKSHGASGSNYVVDGASATF
jgi:hypothetical protein